MTSIPKIIWQTYEVDYDDLQNDYKMASLTWQNLNPDWDYRYINAKERREQVKKYDKDILKFYDKCNSISQSDIWRFIVLYQYGGVYSDMDSLCSMSIEHMISHFSISKEVVCVPMSGEFLITGTFAAKKKSYVFKNVIEEIAYGKNVFLSFGPVAHIGWDIISSSILKNKELIDFLFVGVFHGSHAGGEYKYSSDFSVRINDSFIPYSVLAKRNNWIY